MSTKAELQKALDRLIGDADEQTQLYESSTQRLYKTLGEVYLWWRDAPEGHPNSPTDGHLKLPHLS